MNKQFKASLKKKCKCSIICSSRPLNPLSWKGNPFFWHQKTPRWPFYCDGLRHMASILRLQLRLRLWIRIPNPSQVTGRAVLHYGNARWPQFWTGREWADPGQSQSSKVKWNKRWQQQKLCQVFPAKHESSAITRAPRQTEKQKAKGKKRKAKARKARK